MKRVRPLTPPRSASAEPAYAQIKRHIQDRIADGTWPEGTRLPAERDLASTLGVSRMTVHRALRELKDEGILVRQQGSGTFVAPSRPTTSVFEIVDLAHEIEARGGAHHAEILGLGRTPAPPHVAVAAGVAPGTELAHVLILHSEDGVPVQLEDRYVRPDAAPEFLDQDFSTQTPGGYLLAHVPFAEAEHRISAVAADAIQAARLRVPECSPLLLLERRTFAADGTVVTVVQLFHPGGKPRLGGRFGPRA